MTWCCSQAQGELSGCWTNGEFFATSDISFLPNHRFTFLFMHCTGMESGEGYYVIQNNRLNLHFDSRPDTSGPELNTTSTPAGGQFVNIQLHILSRPDYSPALFVAATISDKKGIIQAQASDMDGNVQFGLFKSGDTVYLDVNSPFYGKIRHQPLVPNQNYSIDVILPQGNFYKTVPYGTVHTYTILRRNEREMILVNEGGTEEIFTPKKSE